MKQTYADQARQIINSFKTRLGEDLSKADPFALESLKQKLGKLKDKQEATRTKLGLSNTPIKGTGGYDDEPVGYGTVLAPTEYDYVPGVQAYDFTKPQYSVPNASLAYPENPYPFQTSVSQPTAPPIQTVNPNTKKVQTVRPPSKPTTYPPLVSTPTMKTEFSEDNGTWIDPNTGAYSMQSNYGSQMDSSLQQPGGVRYEQMKQPQTSPQTSPQNYNTNFSSVSPVGLIASTVSGLYALNRANNYKEDIPYTPIAPKLVNYDLARQQVRSNAKDATGDLLKVAKASGNMTEYLNTVTSGLGKINKASNSTLNTLYTGQEDKNADITNRVNMINSAQKIDVNRQKLLFQRYKEQLRMQALDTILSGAAQYASDVSQNSAMNTAMALPRLNETGNAYQMTVDPRYQNMSASQKTLDYLLGRQKPTSMQFLNTGS